MRSNKIRARKSNLMSDTIFCNYYLRSAEDSGEWGHAYAVMLKLSEALKFEIVDAVSHPIGELWQFKIRGLKDSKRRAMPSYIKLDVPEIGQ